jgi:hypothetical protein
MRLCLLTSDPRQSPAGERVAALAQRLGDATVVATGNADWPGAVHIDELSGSYDVAVAFGWRACLHVFRPEARAYAYAVPAMEDALMWQGDEQRLLAALTYDLPLTLMAPSKAVAAALEERGAGAVAVVRQGSETAGSDANTGEGERPSPRQASDPSPAAALRVFTAAPAEQILDRMTEAATVATTLAAADVLLELPPADAPLTQTPQALRAGCVPIVTPVDGHDELVEDSRSGVVIGFDDIPGAARALDTLARDRALLATLREGALDRARTLPTLDDEAQAFRAALEQALTSQPDRHWPRRLLLNARAIAEPLAQERRALEQALRERDEALAAREPAAQDNSAAAAAPSLRALVGRMRRRR